MLFDMLTSIGAIHLEHLLAKTDQVGAPCSDIILIGILIFMTYTTGIFAMFAVRQLTCADYSTLADHQMIAAHTDLQFGVSNMHCWESHMHACIVE